jgi:hypothetical protein
MRLFTPRQGGTGHERTGKTTGEGKKPSTYKKIRIPHMRVRWHGISLPRLSVCSGGVAAVGELRSGLSQPGSTTREALLFDGEPFGDRNTECQDAHQVTILASELAVRPDFVHTFTKLSITQQNTSAKTFRLSLADSCGPFSVREDARFCKAGRLESSGDFRRLLAKNTGEN